MKNLKRIVSLVCVVAMMLSMSAFAAMTDGAAYNFQLKADKTTIKAGDTFYVTIYSNTSDPGTHEIEVASAYIDYISTEFTAEKNGTASTVGISGYKYDSSKDNYLWLMDETIKDVDFTNMYTFKFTAASNITPGVKTIVLSNVSLMDSDANMNTKDAAYTLTITVEEEEDDPVAVIDTEAGGVSADNTVYGKTVNGGTVTYNNVWIGRYKVTPGSKTITSATLTFNYDTDNDGINDTPKTLDTAALNISGDGTYQFAIAVVGVPSGAEAAIPALTFN